MEDVKRKAVRERDEVKQSKTTHPYGNAVAKPTASNAITVLSHLQEGVIEYTYNPSTQRMETGGSGLQGYRKLEINMGCIEPISNGVWGCSSVFTRTCVQS